MTTTYQGLKKTLSDELDKFPMYFAFSNEQFEAGLKKINATKDEVLSIGGGGFIRKTDKKEFRDMFDRRRVVMAEAMQDDKFMVSAIIYELGNHEFCITYDPADTVDRLDLDLDDERTRRCFAEAKGLYLGGCEDY